MKWLLALLIAAGLVTMAPAAEAGHDTRPCVSRVEFNSTHGRHIKRHDLEDRWEVTPIPGRSQWTAITAAMQYQACGYSIDDAAIYVVYLRKNHEAEFILRGYNPLVAPHGRP